MSFSKHFNDVLSAGEGNYLTKFKDIKRVDVQIAIYQKLLYKAGEQGENQAAAQNALNSIHEALQNWFPEFNVEDNFDEVLNLSEREFLDEFKQLNRITQVAIYQKLLDKAKEEGEESAAKQALDSIHAVLINRHPELNVTKDVGEILKAGEAKYLEAFKKHQEPDMQIAIYQKLLHLAALKGKNSAAQKALDKINADFKSLFPELKELITINEVLNAHKQHKVALEDFNALKSGIEIERKRYEVAKANAIYQDYLYRKTFERVKDEEDLLFDPQARLVYELTLTPEERAEVLKEMKDAIDRQRAQQPSVSHDVKEKGVVDEILDATQVDAQLKEILGGRTPTKTTLCSIDLGCKIKIDKASPDTVALFMDLRQKFVKQYGAKNLVAHQRASMIASFEETYAHMSLMARTYEGISRQFDKDEDKATPPMISKQDWQNIRKQAASKLQDQVAEIYKKAVAKATNSHGGVDLYALNKNLAKERVKLADFSKQKLIEEVVSHLKAQGRAGILNYMQNLSSSLKKDSFTERTATGYDYFYTSNYLQQGMLITGTENTAHDKPAFKTGIEDQVALRRVTYTYRDPKGVLQPTSAVSSRIPSPALVFNGMSEEGIKKDLVQKFGFLHEQMRAMRGGKDGPAVESLFTSFHSAAFEIVADNGNLQRTSALYIMQAMHDFNTPWHIRAQKLKAQVEKFKEENPGAKDEANKARQTIAAAEDGLKREAEQLKHQQKFEKERQLLGLEEELREATEQAEIQQRESPPKNNFLYIQNIGTNRQTRDLGYRDERSILTGSLELDDITLSVEMAMLHTLQENSAFLSANIKEQLSVINATVLKEYREFLLDGSRPIYFADSPQGKKLIRDITAFKNEFKSELDKEAQAVPEIKSMDLPSLASNTLARMIATNQHWDSRYGQLGQALSMYIEWASTGGCKSGNERNQDVMLRFALLKSIHERVEHDGNKNGLRAHEEAIFTEMEEYLQGKTPDPEALRAAIAVSVSKCNMHGGAAAISREDQGGAAKVSSFSAVQDIRSPFLQWTARIAILSTLLLIVPLVAFAFPKGKKFFTDLFDTNNAADKEMKLDATGASKTQAHKGQDKRTRDVVLQVINDHPSFQGEHKLTSEEKDLFKEGSVEEKQPKPPVNLMQPNKVPDVSNADTKEVRESAVVLANLGPPIPSDSQIKTKTKAPENSGTPPENRDAEKITPPSPRTYSTNSM